MEERNLRKTRTGKVVSDKMDKTIVVLVEDNVVHPLYGKIVRKSVRFKAHDENNDCGVGDKVDLEASFCLGHCAEGVTIKIDDEIVTGLTGQNVQKVFEERVLPEVQK